ncbi:hypothetical protein [Streptomyces sp. NPDC101237]|uniref:hypothetical protein n=1 Tax=Streptomyces sp. NPDC101237 TaxID=3366139 RepID=UPI0038199410
MSKDQRYMKPAMILTKNVGIRLDRGGDATVAAAKLDRSSRAGPRSPADGASHRLRGHQSQAQSRTPSGGLPCDAVRHGACDFTPAPTRLSGPPPLPKAARISAEDNVRRAPYRRTVTVLPTPAPYERWLPKVTIQSGRADDLRWDRQRAALRSISSYDGVTQTWCTWIGVLDLANIAKPRTRFDAARTFGTEVPHRARAGNGRVDGTVLHGRYRDRGAVGYAGRCGPMQADASANSR